MKPKSASHHRRWVLRLFEWAIVTCVIGLLCGIFLHRIERAQALIEQRNFQSTVKAMQAAVFLQSVLRPQDVSAGGNPANMYFEQFGILPTGYVGELDRPDPAAVAGGNWYFDLDEKLLVYRIANAQNFCSSSGGPVYVRLQLVREKGSERLIIRSLNNVCWVAGGN